MLRRLQIVTDLIQTAGLTVLVDWVPSANNLADVMTRVPVAWVRHCREMQEGDAVPVAAASVPPPVSMAEIVEAQAGDPEMQAAIARVLEQLPLTGRYAAVGSKLEVSDGVLFRSVKLPVEGTVRVPVIAESLVDTVVERAHDSSGHANWQTMYKVICSRDYFPGIASACHDFVAQCSKCKAASPERGNSAAPTRSDIPSA